MPQIIALMADLASKVIDAGKSVADLWCSVGGIIADAEKTGKVDADAARDRNADEARAG